jgi:hypothetical protein
MQRQHTACKVKFSYQPAELKYLYEPVWIEVIRRVLLVSENGSSICHGAMVSSVSNLDSCCSSLVMARILTNVTSSGASSPTALAKLPEEFLVPAQSK